MAMYIILIAYILLVTLVAAYVVPDARKRQLVILRLGMFAIFLLLALKKDTVGIDISGYKEQYLLSAAVPWSNTSYVYFEPGYIQLMKLFSKPGIDFQLFAAVIYGVCCYAYYMFMVRYSKDAALSLMIFICYQFLVFYTSGLRQALAMAMCIYAFLLVDGTWGRYWGRLGCSILLVLAAAMIHKSALLFLIVILFIQWKPKNVHWVLMVLLLGASVAARPLLLWFIRSYIGSFKGSGGITLGGNFIFLVGLTLLGIVGYYQNGDREEGQNIRFLAISVNTLMMAVIANILFSGSTMLRSSMYLTIFLIPGLPCVISCFERRIQILLSWFLGLFLIVLFWTDTLSVNQLGLCPYLFFWQ